MQPAFKFENTFWFSFHSWICLKRQIRAEEEISKPTYQFSTEEWVSDANNWNDNDESSTSQSVLLDEATSLMGRASIKEKNANELLCEVYTDYENESSAEIEPDENEPITLDSPILPKSNIANLLSQKPVKVRHDYNFIIVPCNVGRRFS